MGKKRVPKVSSFRWPERLVARLREAAKKHKRTFSAEGEVAIEKYLESLGMWTEADKKAAMKELS